MNRKTETRQQQLARRLSETDMGAVLPLTLNDWNIVAHYATADTEKPRGAPDVSSKLSRAFALLNKPDLTRTIPPLALDDIAREIFAAKPSLF